MGQINKVLKQGHDLTFSYSLRHKKGCHNHQGGHIDEVLIWQGSSVLHMEITKIIDRITVKIYLPMLLRHKLLNQTFYLYLFKKKIITNL